MASFNEVDGVPATANRWLMTDVLRKQWGFNGFVVTDFTGISEWWSTASVTCRPFPPVRSTPVWTWIW